MNPIISTALAASKALAQNNNQQLDLTTALADKLTFFGFSVNNIFGWALGIGGTVALGIIIFGGVMYIASAGNVSRQADAKEWIKAAIYGLILLAIGYIILYTINPAILGR